MPDLEDGLADLIDDDDFRKIDKHLRRFNMFEAMGAVRGELRHSNFLSFILSPTRPHGIGSELLLQFIRAAIAKQPANRQTIRSIELIIGDLDSAVIHREQDNIDLLIELKQLNLIVLVENKIDAVVGDGQLLRYKNVVRSRYPDFRQLYILLTPDGIHPEDDDYVGLSYSEVADLVDYSIDRNELLGPDIALILNHYVQMLRRHIVEDEQLAELARQVYERHKEAFNFIFDKRPQPDNLLDGIKALLESNTDLIADQHSRMILRFLPKEWDSILEFNSCPEREWTHTKHNLLFEVKANRETDRISISLISGPTEPEIRKTIYEFASKRPKLFVGLVRPMGAKTATIFIKDLLSANAAVAMETDEKQESLKKAWSEFLLKDLPALKAELAEIFK